MFRFIRIVSHANCHASSIVSQSSNKKIFLPANKKSVFNYYEDDGSTYAYQTGEYYSRKMTYDSAVQEICLDLPEGSMGSKFKKVKAVFHGFEDGIEFELNGQKIKKQISSWKFIEPLQDYDPQNSVRNDHPEKIFLCYFDLQNELQEISWT